MKYKTTIQITTEAADKNEALEIVGEYLSGNLVSGIEMKCRTNRAVNYRVGLVACTAFSFVIIAGVVLAVHFKSSTNPIQNSYGSSAIQPPLRTSYPEGRNAGFKKDWQNTEAKRALEYIKR
ncbi:MAG: hypothetical protein V1927_03875 [Candidatus Omnitrophota bacterium]